jgi:hypothetical protein
MLAMEVTAQCTLPKELTERMPGYQVVLQLMGSLQSYTTAKGKHEKLNN